MTTTVITTAPGPILALDLGKYKCVACVDRTAAEPTFQTVGAVPLTAKPIDNPWLTHADARPSAWHPQRSE